MSKITLEQVIKAHRVLGDFLHQEQSNYHEKVKEILWEYISKNDEEEIFKRIAEIK
tara:strand:+ start:981 stop:1148 length:168 start_codon:yes stop_codon:yes gene_type:complete